jgi:TetR/AcrR family transcriptional repressor of nem operon
MNDIKSTDNLTRTALLVEATNMLQTGSFGRLSFQLLADKVGIKKGSVYYHFPSKDLLAIAILERAKEQLEDYFILFENDKPTIQLKRYIQVFSKYIQPMKKLCPGASFITSWQHESPNIQNAIYQLYQTHLKYLENVIHQGQKLGVFKVSLDDKVLANVVFSLLQGALLSARTCQSTVAMSACEAAISELTELSV